MVFSSPIFLFCFLPILLAIYGTLKGRLEVQNTFLLLGSLLFYAWGEEFYLLVMLASIAINYISGMAIAYLKDKKHQKISLIISIILNLLLLASFKYANFIVDNVNILLLSVNIEAIILAPIHKPIGLSFFTFQAISYIVDVYRNHTAVQRNILHVALYISLFPQLIAGPIVRYAHISHQLSNRKVTLGEFSYGIERFIIGLGKKVLIADNLAIIIDPTFGTPAQLLSPEMAWISAFCFALQIYFDFSGYSDMAIGIGRMLGFTFRENFNYPYYSKSFTELCTGWHISMATWFRDYIYLPLCGRRPKALRAYFSLFIVFFLCGLWHGASWTFVIWGLTQGLFLAIERIARHTKLRKYLRASPLLLKHLYVVLIAIFGAVMFRSPDISYMYNYYISMFGFGSGTTTFPISTLVLCVIIAGTITATPAIKNLHTYLKQIMPKTASWLYLGLLISILCLGALNVSAHSYQPFIYFRF